MTQLGCALLSLVALVIFAEARSATTNLPPIKIFNDISFEIMLHAPSKSGRWKNGQSSNRTDRPRRITVLTLSPDSQHGSELKCRIKRQSLPHLTSYNHKIISLMQSPDSSLLVQITDRGDAMYV